MIIKSSTDIVAMQEEVRQWLFEKGWDQDNRSFGDELILIASELIEALEAYRVRGYDEWLTYQPTINGVKMPKLTEEQLEAIKELTYPRRETPPDFVTPPPRREGVAAELAGTLVRLLDSCARHGIDLGEEFRKEMDYNWERSWRHGGKRL